MPQDNSEQTYNFDPKSFSLLFDNTEADFSLRPGGTWIKIRFAGQGLSIGMRFVRYNRSHGRTVPNITIENLQPIDLLFLSTTQKKPRTLEKTVTLLWGTTEQEGMHYREMKSKQIEVHENWNGNEKEPNFELLVKYLSYNSTLYIAYFDAEGIKIETGIPIDAEYDIFRLFTYEPNSVSQFNVEVLDLGKLPENRSFRMSGLVVRAGDMFNSDALLNANLLLLPASDEMKISSPLSFRVKELGIPQMENPQKGNIEVYRISQEPEIYAGYAYSVSGDTSSINLIAHLCRSISKFVKHKNRTPGTITGINLPLLGTGAGGLEPAAVLDIYYDVFYKEEYIALPVIVSIPSAQTFAELKKRYHGSSIPLIKKYVNSKPAIISAVERMMATVIPPSNFELDFRGNLISLGLTQCTIESNFGRMGIFKDLRHLSLNQCRAENLNSLLELPHLNQLSLRGSEIRDLDFLALAQQLEYLDLGWIKGPLRSIIYELSEKLKFLSLAGNELQDGEFLHRLPALEQLDLSNNNFYHLQILPKLKRLHMLDISYNQISDLSPLKGLKKLRTLNMQHNQVAELEPISLFERLQYLRAEGNPLAAKADLILNEQDNNHVAAIQNYLSRQAEQRKKSIKLPAKVLLMGNHASGKSSLLNYLIKGELPQRMESTHIIQIQQYPAKTQEMPKAIFYDFGGQDYYHGIYRAFLSGGAIHLLLWNAKHNINQVRTDSNSLNTQDFSLDYWIAQKQYLEIQENGDGPWPTLLVQTHADIHPKENYPKSAIEGLENDFFVCLDQKANFRSTERAEVNNKALAYLQSSLLALIEDRRVTKLEPEWYIDFLKYILKQTSEADHKGMRIKDLLPFYGKKGTNKLESLKEDLDQFHKQGLILYYKHHLPDIVWLNPVALTKHIHQNILNNQQIEKNTGLVSSFAKAEPQIVDLLVKQQVIYLHKTTGDYIIPNFLSLAKTSVTEFELYTFGLGAPLFTLKFANFIPFGLINQIICFFGELPEEKKFWRDRIIFTLDKKAKILINLDFKCLEIKVYVSFLPELQARDRNEIQKFLFYGIVGMYWNFELLSFKDYVAFLQGTLKKDSFDVMDSTHTKISNAEMLDENPSCKPDDLYLSINEVDFISCRTLCEVDGSAMIDSRSVDKNGNFTGQHKAIAVYPFQPFTSQPLHRRKNVAISYSKKDLEMVQKFREYLIPLYDDELIDHPWYCTELEAGKEWNSEIQSKFDQADIIFFMISENLMSTRYVIDHEIKNAIDKYDRGEKLKIVPILMVPYQFARKPPYDLSRFTALPYALHPVALFDNPLEAWDIITQSIRIMIEKDLDPNKDGELPSELNTKFQKIIRMKMGRRPRY